MLPTIFTFFCSNLNIRKFKTILVNHTFVLEINLQTHSMKMIYNIVFIIAIVSAGIQLIYILGVFSRISFYKRKPLETVDLPPVSIVISARNEHHNLLHNLKSILEQDYPDFEVVLVNDQSTDDSEFYLKTLESTYKHLKIVNVKNPIVFFKGKKFPLSIGIKSATNDILLLTDADCKPSSPNWIKEMVYPYSEQGSEIVLGYGAYAIKKGLLNFIIRFDTMRTAMQYLSFAKIGIPYMGVGRNLSYKKELFFREHGFQKHYKIESGDDDLFVNHAANSKNTKIVLSPEAKTISVPKTKFISWWHQKRRHLTTGRKYKKSHLFLLAILDISYLFFITSSIFLLVSNYEIIIISAILALRYASYLLIFKKAMIKVGEQKLLLISPLLEALLSVLLPIISVTNIFYSKSKWK